MGDLSAVEVDGVHKRFRLRHTHSLKESLAGPSRDGRRGTTSPPSPASTCRCPRVSPWRCSGGTARQVDAAQARGRRDGARHGEVRVRGRVAGLLEVGAGLHPDLTGRENVFLDASILGMAPAEVRARFDDIVEFADIGDFLDTQVRFYSSGMFLRLAFAVAVHTDPDVFLVDEILAVGDEPFRAKCLARIELLRREGRTLVVVSHDLDLVSRLCTRGIVLASGRVVADGPVAQTVAAWRAA